MRSVFSADDSLHADEGFVEKTMKKEGFDCVFELSGNKTTDVPEVNLISVFAAPC